MANSTITYPPADPTISNTKVSTPSNTSVELRTGTMIQDSGVDVTDEFDTLDFAFEIEETPAKTLEIRAGSFQDDGVNLDDVSIIDFITNIPIIESPSETLEISDTVIQKNGVPIKAGPKQINFIGDILVTELDGTVTVNLAGKGFFGDGSDGDYTLDGTQTSVANLFERDDVSSPINIIGIQQATLGTIVDIFDASPSYPDKTKGLYLYTDLESACNLDFANICLIQTQTDHGYVTGDSVFIQNVAGTTEVNGVREIIVVSELPDYFFVIGVTFANAYVSGGTTTKLATYRLLRDAFFDDLTITTGAKLLTSNFRLFVKSILDIDGRIDNSGGFNAYTGYYSIPLSGASGGAGGATSFPDSQQGFPGTTGDNIIDSIFPNDVSTEGYGGAGAATGNGSGGDGGLGGAGGAHGAETLATASRNERSILVYGMLLKTDLTLAKIKCHAAAGGGGGGGVGHFTSVSIVGGTGGAGGAGGDNGGFILICAHFITGTGKIKSNGEVGGRGAETSDFTDSNHGGGGGGGGGGAAGVIVLMYSFKSDTIVTEKVGGYGGLPGLSIIIDRSGIGPPVYISGGNPGYPGETGEVVEFNIT